MVIVYNNNPEVLLNLKDCLELIPHELAEAIKYFYENDSETTQSKYNDLKDEFNSYEMSNESLTSCLNEVLGIAEKLKDKVDDCKKLDREKITNTLDDIIIIINNEI